MAADNGGGSGPAFRRTDRTDAPYYLARYTERRGGTVRTAEGGHECTVKKRSLTWRS